MKSIPTKTTYLEMTSPFRAEPAVPESGLQIERLRKPSVDSYRFLYNSVGSEYRWIDRNLMADDVLQQIIQDDDVEIYVLEVAGRPAGFAELDRRVSGQIELAYIGLFPEFIGRGLGKYFLGWSVDRAWSYRPERVWLHTCDLDHPAALPTYLKAGFTVYDERVIDQVVIDS